MLPTPDRLHRNALAFLRGIAAWIAAGRLQPVSESGLFCFHGKWPDFPLAFPILIPYNDNKLLTLSISLRERCRHRFSAAWDSMGMLSVAAPVRGGNFYL